MKKFEGITKASAFKFYLSITQNKKSVKNSEHNGQLSVLKTKPIYSTYQANDKSKKRKKWQASSGKIDSSEDIFHISFNHSWRYGKV